MVRYSKPWLAGAAIAEVRKTDADVRIMLNIFVKSNAAFAVVRCLDRNEQTIVGDDGKPLTLYNFELYPSGPRPIPFGRRYQRAREIFGRYTEFFHDSILLDVPKDLWREVNYLELDVFTGSLKAEAGREEKLSAGHTDWIYLELSQRKLVAVGNEKLFLLITKDEAPRRMTKLILEQPVLLEKKPAVMRAMSDLMIQHFRGGDTPLLTEDLG